MVTCFSNTIARPSDLFGICTASRYRRLYTMYIERLIRIGAPVAESGVALAPATSHQPGELSAAESGAAQPKLVSRSWRELSRPRACRNEQVAASFQPPVSGKRGRESIRWTDWLEWRRMLSNRGGIVVLLFFSLFFSILSSTWHVVNGVKCGHTL